LKDFHAVGKSPLSQSILGVEPNVVSTKTNRNRKFEQIVTDLRILIKDCDYQQEDELLRDQIVFTVRSPKIREKLINKEVT
jgi:hypothetical protein